MSRYEIKVLKRVVRPSLLEIFTPRGLNIVEELWWRFMPGARIIVPWPKGYVKGTYRADPNYHYRPWLEKTVGKQGWDWNWGLATHEPNDLLVIKFRRKHAKYATMAKLLWS